MHTLDLRLVWTLITDFSLVLGAYIRFESCLGAFSHVAAETRNETEIYKYVNLKKSETTQEQS